MSCLNFNCENLSCLNFNCRILNCQNFNICVPKYNWVQELSSTQELMTAYLSCTTESKAKCKYYLFMRSLLMMLHSLITVSLTCSGTGQKSTGVTLAHDTLTRCDTFSRRHFSMHWHSFLCLHDIFTVTLKNLYTNYTTFRLKIKKL